jgi:hypothetical protein
MTGTGKKLGYYFFELIFLHGQIADRQKIGSRVVSLEIVFCETSIRKPMRLQESGKMLPEGSGQHLFPTLPQRASAIPLVKARQSQSSGLLNKPPSLRVHFELVSISGVHKAVTVWPRLSQF